MRTAGLVIFIFIVGFLLGGWGPKGRILDLEASLRESRDQLANASKRNHSVLGGVSQMLDIPDDLHRTSDLPVAQNSSQEMVELSVVTPEASTNETAGSEPEEPTSLEAQLDLAADAWALRSEIARNSFVEKVKLDDPQAIRFNVLVEAMNIRIEDTIATFVENIEDDSSIAREEFGLRLAREISDVMVLTYDELDRNMPSNWRDEAGADFSLSDLIDPHVAMPLVDVEDRLNFN